VFGYPALLDDGDSVSLRIFTTPAMQTRVMRAGVRRLLLLAVNVTRKQVVQGLTNAQRLAIARSERVELDEIADQCIASAADLVVSEFVERHGELPFEAEAFAELVADGRARLAPTAGDALRAAAEVVAAANGVESTLDRMVSALVATTVDDARRHLRRLVRRRFVATAGVRRLPDVLRYVRGIERRLDKVNDGPMRDAQRLRTVATLEARYEALLDAHERSKRPLPTEAVELGWLLEELRVSEFAQTLGTAVSVSPQRISRDLARLGA
jgi:ATP-dependent helicase HrpA